MLLPMPRASSGSSFRSRTGSIISPNSVSTSSLQPALSSIEDKITLDKSRDSEARSSAGTLPPAMAKFPQTNMESLQIPPSLLGPDPADAEQFWSGLAPELHLTSPAPYSTFRELYLNIYPYLWLQGRVWHGDQSPKGTLLITRYSPQSGKMEFAIVVGVMANGDPFAESTVVAPKLRLESAILGLKNENLSMHHEEVDLTKPYSFHRISPLFPEVESSASKRSLWPPVIFPAKDRTSRLSSRQPIPLVKYRSYSLNLFELKKNSTSALDLLNGSQRELFSALDPKLYTPNLQHPLRGIWCSSGHRFYLLQQHSRNQVEGFKLTGNYPFPSGVRSFVFEDIQVGISNGTSETRILWSGGKFSVAPGNQPFRGK